MQFSQIQGPTLGLPLLTDFGKLFLFIVEVSFFQRDRQLSVVKVIENVVQA